eukprot:TRINITY_DN5532_c0_g1_i4.p1 TRINITY_DN5532_c0_g1~~TRINITY_DN5532_c0_g1_i4.p1  ORF type:complete len:1331 (-),score=319.41 TRINITY_DN5532_c0_g1_i4:48-4040(-)
MVFEAERTFLTRHDLNRHFLLTEQLKFTNERLEEARIVLENPETPDEVKKEKEKEIEANMKKRILLGVKLKEIELSQLSVFLDGVSADSIAIITCNVCKKDIPLGQPRHHCTECNDYDLCLTCNGKGEHKEHVTYFEKSNTTEYHTKVSVAPSVALSFKQAFACYADRPCLGERDRAGYVRDEVNDAEEDNQEGGPLHVDNLGNNTTQITQYPFRYLKYKEVMKRVVRFGSGLVHSFQLAPQDMIAICGDNSVEWALSDMGAICMGLVTVPLHVQLTSGDVQKIINNCNIKGVVCGNTAILNKFISIQPNCPSLTWFIKMNDKYEPRSARGEPALSHPNVHTFAEMESIGKQNKKPIYEGGKRDDLLTLIHTSGSTGVPKGAMMTEKLWKFFTANNLESSDNLTALCFDPLCHISEREAFYYSFCSGGRVAFCPSPAHTFEDIALAHPTRLASTPRLWNVLYSQFNAELARRQALDSSADPATVRQAVRQDVREIFGPRIMSVSSGGAPTSRVVLDFLVEIFGESKVSDGYGCTEAGSIADKNGDLSIGVQIRLQDVPELGYFSQPTKATHGSEQGAPGGAGPLHDPTAAPFSIEANSTGGTPSSSTSYSYMYSYPDGDFVPRGLLWVKTGNTIAGYYNNPDATSSSLKDGWFCTGDIVEVHTMKQPGFVQLRIRIIDRLKNFFKLAQGEFVAAENLEVLYLGACDLIDQIFVTCGDITKHAQNRITVVVVPNFKVLCQWVLSQGAISHLVDEDIMHLLSTRAPVGHTSSAQAICQHPLVQAHLLDSIQKAGAKLNLRPFEIPWAVILEPCEYTVQNGLMTASNKLNRPALERTYRDKVNARLESRTSDLANKELGMALGEDAQGFIEQGGDSLSAVRLSALARARYGVEIRPEDILKAKPGKSTIENMADMESLVAASSAVSVDIAKTILEDVSLYEGMIKALPSPPPSPSPVSGPDAILLTGASGYVGAFLLHDIMLARPGTTVFCLIRASSDAEARDRLTRVMVGYQLWASDRGLPDSVVCVAGDLGRDSFGLDAAAYTSLSQKVRRVYHCGAYVNHVKGYTVHKPANVVGTYNVVKFCFSGPGGPLPLHYVSTLGVFTPPRSDYCLGEDEDLDGPAGRGELATAGGYSQSKWAADKLVVAAREHGCPATIYRLGMVSWSTSSGKSNEQDWVTRLFLGLMHLPATPRSRAKFNLIPVDFVSKSIVHIAEHGPPKHGVYHLCNPDHLARFSEIWEAICAEKQPPTHPNWIEFVPWWDELIRMVQTSSHETRLVDPLLMFEQGIPSDDTRYKIDHMREAGQEPPTIPQESVRAFARHIVGLAATKQQCR